MLSIVCVYDENDKFNSRRNNFSTLPVTKIVEVNLHSTAVHANRGFYLRPREKISNKRGSRLIDQDQGSKLNNFHGCKCIHFLPISAFTMFLCFKLKSRIYY